MGILPDLLGRIFSVGQVRRRFQLNLLIYLSVPELSVQRIFCQCRNTLDPGAVAGHQGLAEIQGEIPERMLRATLGPTPETRLEAKKAPLSWG